VNWWTAVLLGMIPLLGIPIALLISHAWPLYPDQPSALDEIVAWAKSKVSNQERRPDA